ncbi:palmitoyltransferase ZDHHC19-like isoform X3 [Marmota marmota marmota]|uniref:palmitoyltransferase ZDHHC19-like isoform X3 n=1 Tax=Marmota marmota marmota TaxID=9994 RepID=UPI00209400BF|nr:palmitoyltransferase ZDHHC19-like isoform X3 [Marmota marmota marmota]
MDSEMHDKAFNEGCPRNCYIALCAPLGPKYMSEAVCIQVDQRTNWGPTEHLKDLLWPRSATQAPKEWQVCTCTEGQCCNISPGDARM